MILQIDAWNIRERDQWGESAACRRQGREPERWHWVYTGTCFRLDHRAQTAGGRPVIIERGFVATREGIDALREQLHAEARRRGLGQAAGALVIADGAVWIWRLADDRFPGADQRLDFYHAVQHLAAVGRAVCGEDQTKLKAWLQPLVCQLKNESAVKVIRQLEDLLATLKPGASAVTVQTEVNYFHEHQTRMDYRAGRRRGEPLGSGVIEATCRQYQCRFKRPGHSGAAPATKRCCAWKLSGATAADTCFSLTPSPWTPQETEMRPLSPTATLTGQGAVGPGSFMYNSFASVSN